MTAFLKKYKWTIVYIVVLLFFLLYFNPSQNKYYIDQDIKHFKTLYLIPTLFWTFGLLSVMLFIYCLIKSKSLKQATYWFFPSALKLAFIFFAFQNFFLSIALFTNRQMIKGKITKTYQVFFLAGVDSSKSNFFLYDTSTKHFIYDRKLTDKFYSTELKQNDNIFLPMKIGLFGVQFTSHPLNGKY